MSSTPAHDSANPDLLSIMPATARRVIEVGCSSGALAREYKKRNPQSRYVGIEFEAEFREFAARHCDRVEILDIETLADTDIAPRFHADCWVFGDSLEHLREPWQVLRNIRSGTSGARLRRDCVPNAQHWSVQARLCTGRVPLRGHGLAGQDAPALVHAHHVVRDGQCLRHSAIDEDASADRRRTEQDRFLRTCAPSPGRSASMPRQAVEDAIAPAVRAAHRARGTDRRGDAGALTVARGPAWRRCTVQRWSATRPTSSRRSFATT